MRPAGFPAFARPMLIASASLLLLGPVRPAPACTIPIQPPALRGYPASGAVDVPLDVVPLYHAGLGNVSGSARLAGASFRLTTAAGESVPISVRPQGSHFELAPAAHLQPRTGYRLEMSVPHPRPESPPVLVGLTFTTGDGLAAPPLTLHPRIQHFSAPGVSCSEFTCEPCPPRLGTCILRPAGTFVQYEFGAGENFPETAGTVARFFYEQPVMADMTGLGQDATQTSDHTRCVRLRSRAANGVLGPPAVICREQGQGFTTLEGAEVVCTPSGLASNGRLLSERDDFFVQPGIQGRFSPPDSSGCALAGRPARASALGWLGGLAMVYLAALPWLRGRCRRSGRRS